MKVTQIETARNGFPCSAIEIDMDMVERIASAFRAGVKVSVAYANLDGTLNRRECFVESMYQHLHYVVIKGRDFGYRTVFFERIVEVK